MKLYKYIVIGPTNSGKTSIITKYFDNNANISNIKITIGSDFYYKCFSNYKLHIWDTAGVIKYNNMNSIFEKIDKNNLKVIIVFDYNNYDQQSLDSFINSYAVYDILIVFNKVPLTHHNLYNYNNKYRNHSILYVNAAENININRIFDINVNINNTTPPINKKNKKCSIL
jgi:small GTP-binding protein